jgi:hypothetical protein
VGGSLRGDIEGIVTAKSWERNEFEAGDAGGTGLIDWFGVITRNRFLGKKRTAFSSGHPFEAIDGARLTSVA